LVVHRFTIARVVSRHRRGKGERRRIQRRFIGAMEAATVNQGRFLSGRPPYG
jgi:hypothetical protein